MATKHYRVNLEIFEGPLDLLLYLIKKNDLDILNIEISKITKEYLDYLELMQELNLEVVGEFLVMASTLMQIKAKSLLPSAETSPEETGPDPRSELVAKLVEYQKFKEAANFLKNRSEEFQNVFYRGAPAFEEREKALNIRIFDLLGTLREVLDRAEDEGRIVQGEEFPIEDKIEKILKLLSVKPYLKLVEVFEGERRRRAIITCFMALLELIKTQRVFARQDHPFAPIMIYKKEAPAEPLSPVWPDDSQTPEPEIPSASEPAPEAEQGFANGAPPWRRRRHEADSLGEIDPEAAAAAKRYLEQKMAQEEILARSPKPPEEFELPPDRPSSTAGREAPMTPAPAGENQVEEVPVEEAPVAEVPAEEAPAAEAPVEEVPAEEAPVAEVPAEEVQAAEAPAETDSEREISGEEPCSEEPPVEEPPVDNTRKAWAGGEDAATLRTDEEDEEPETRMNFQDEPGAAPGGPDEEEETRDD